MLKISDAANLALHAMSVLAAANGNGQSSVTRLAKRLGVSEHHLAKVMQRLSKVGLVKSRRGPKGGFSLGKPAEDILLMEVFEAIEGPLPERTCLLDRKVCEGKHCLLGDLVQSVNTQVREHLANTRLSEMKPGFAGTGE